MAVAQQAPVAKDAEAAASSNMSGLHISAKQEVVENIAVAAETMYVEPAAGAKLAQHLRERLGTGAYDMHADPAGFAAALTSDLRSVVPDLHLRVAYEPNRSASTGPMQPRRYSADGASAPRMMARIDGRSNDEIARTNFGFDRVERLEGNVGYLKLTRLVPPDLSRPTAEAAMAFLAHSDAVIIDVRGVPGGSPELVRLLLGHFVEKPLRLLTTYDRPSSTTEEIWTAEVTSGRLAGVPLYVLQDRTTASAAEMLAYIVQRRGLGTVVGETSRGAGNGGNMIEVGSGISFFLPQRRVTDGPGWEGTGVTPDLLVAAAGARDAAHRAALDALRSRRASGQPAAKIGAAEASRALRSPASATAK
ncbi:S41 family peptidase [Sphingomonas sp.]|uniref:S41 family peptidase n=1 Tax=Sphingomonas sp. TaxID=28214 RepID=UPI002DE9647A|nr:S41 family peptidase [Sphingomonas sp.]